MDITATEHSEKAVRLSHAAWRADGEKRFGPDPLKWAFKCPSCGHVMTVADYKAAGASEGQVGFNCIGRHAGGDDVVEICEADKGEGCNYTQGGLFKLARTVVEMEDGREIAVFDFA